jgi:hypothetical protein
MVEPYGAVLPPGTLWVSTVPGASVVGQVPNGAGENAATKFADISEAFAAVELKPST